MTAIQKMVEKIEYEMTLIPKSCELFKAQFQRMLDEARRLAQEEAKENPTAPASLVEDRNKIVAAIVPVMSRRFWEAGDMADAILSRYRPATPSEGLKDIVVGVLNSAVVLDNQGYRCSLSYSETNRIAEEIIAKYNKGAK